MAELLYDGKGNAVYKLSHEDILSEENAALRKAIKTAALNCWNEVPITTCAYSKGYQDCADDVLNWLSFELDHSECEKLGISKNLAKNMRGNF